MATKQAASKTKADASTAAAKGDQGAHDDETIWVMSNRKDDRVVIWERDDRHPGGEAFVGGSAPDEVFRTPEIEGLLRAGLLVEVPEPKGSTDAKADDYNPKKPLLVDALAGAYPAAQPGQAIALGREPDPDLYSESDVEAIKEAVAEAPSEAPAPRGAIVPPPPPGEVTRTGV